MTRKQAIDILDQFNQWRRGQIEELNVPPHHIGGAIDVLIKEPGIFGKNYCAIVLRGCISPGTTDDDFGKKAEEEYREICNALFFESEEKINEEITDLLCVCANWLIHREIDPFDALEKNYVKNMKRVKPD